MRPWMHPKPSSGKSYMVCDIVWNLIYHFEKYCIGMGKEKEN